jgi:hypothetical protein
MQDDAIIARYIEPNPHYPSLDADRVKEHGVSV